MSKLPPPLAMVSCFTGHYYAGLSSPFGHYGSAVAVRRPERSTCEYCATTQKFPDHGKCGSCGAPLRLEVYR